MSERDAFLAAYDVPRGTVDKLDRYAALLVEWQARLNLVGPSTLPSLWSRHFGDSAQLLHLAPPGPAGWLDLGAGAGFPGIIIALLGTSHVTLVESLAKKCRFLDTVIEALDLGAQVTVCNARVETLRLPPAAVISARAFAPLDRLLTWAIHLAGRDTLWLLPKGQSARDELETAQRKFDFDVALHPSLSDSRGQIVALRHVRARARR